MKEKDRMLSGNLYFALDPELQKMASRSKQFSRMYFQTTEQEMTRRTEILKEWLHEVGEDCYIEPPFYCDYGSNTSIGKRFYANYDCVVLDVCPVSIGNHVMFGPRVCLFTATHPTDHLVRSTLLEYGKPITIGDYVWIGGGSIINPGVTIGSKTVIGSGSVVTHNIPSGVIAAGNPCHVIRNISESERKYWTTRSEEYQQSKKE